jgi:hypothetical protein
MIRCGSFHVADLCLACLPASARVWTGVGKTSAKLSFLSFDSIARVTIGFPASPLDSMKTCTLMNFMRTLSLSFDAVRLCVSLKPAMRGSALQASPLCSMPELQGCLRPCHRDMKTGIILKYIILIYCTIRSFDASLRHDTVATMTVRSS